MHRERTEHEIEIRSCNSTERPGKIALQKLRAISDAFSRQIDHGLTLVDADDLRAEFQKMRGILTRCARCIEHAFAAQVAQAFLHRGTLITRVVYADHRMRRVFARIVVVQAHRFVTRITLCPT